MQCATLAFTVISPIVPCLRGNPASTLVQCTLCTFYSIIHCIELEIHTKVSHIGIPVQTVFAVGCLQGQLVLLVYSCPNINVNILEPISGTKLCCRDHLQSCLKSKIHDRALLSLSRQIPGWALAMLGISQSTVG